MGYILYIIIGIVIIQSVINIYLMREVKRLGDDNKVLNSNMDKAVKLLKYLMDRIKSRDNINLN